MKVDSLANRPPMVSFKKRSFSSPAFCARYRTERSSQFSNAGSVSVVIPTFNRAATLGRAIDSVLNQQGIKAQVIVVDDGSTDSTTEVLDRYGDKIKVIQIENGGAPRARNHGALAAVTDYVMFLDSDDWISGDMLSALIAEARESRAKIVFGYVRLIEKNGSSRMLGDHLRECDTNEAVVSAWLRGKYIPPCGVLWERSTLCSIGLWQENRVRNQDGELILRALMAGVTWSLSKQGQGIYDKFCDGPHISATPFSKKGLLQERPHLERVEAWAQANDFKQVPSALGVSAYAFARKAYQANLIDLGNSYLKYARALGFKGHIGKPGHGLVSSILGLRHKEYLWMKLKRLLKRLRPN